MVGCKHTYLFEGTPKMGIGEGGGGLYIHGMKSVVYFSFYLFVVGAVLVVAPNFLLAALGLPVTDEVWIRVAGVLAFNIGIYYYRNAGNAAFARSTILTRVLVFVAFGAFVVLGYGSAVMVIFGAVDAAGAVWTWRELRKLV